MIDGLEGLDGVVAKAPTRRGFRWRASGVLGVSLTSKCTQTSSKWIGAHSQKNCGSIRARRPPARDHANAHERSREPSMAPGARDGRGVDRDRPVQAPNCVSRVESMTRRGDAMVKRGSSIAARWR